MPRRENNLIVRAENNLRSAMEGHKVDLEGYLPFIKTLLRDLKEYQTLPSYSLRRLTIVEMDENASQEDVDRFRAELDILRKALGEDYIDRIEQGIKQFRSEIIIAIENINLATPTLKNPDCG